ncbi:MAG: rhomboid family intramembrane serine protease [Novosphingobium sp.]
MLLPAAAATLIALMAGAVAEIWNPPAFRRWPVVTLAVGLLILGVVALQSLIPGLPARLGRDPQMLSSGEAWRAVTALFAQDGGVPGLLFNLFWLLVLGTLAERRFPRWGWLAAYFGGGIVTEFLALGWQPHGAGNSIACLALAGALCSDWRKGRWRWWRVGAGLAGLAAAGVLLLENDIHGIGFCTGLLIGFALVARGAVLPGRDIPPEIAPADNVVFIRGTGTYH